MTNTHSITYWPMRIINEYLVYRPVLHAKQEEFINSPAKRKIIRAGRRGGKTVGAGIYAVYKFLRERRVLYGAPTTDQLNRFWVTVCRALRDPIARRVIYKNETEHILEIRGTEIRIRGKTCWNADTLRGDYADDLILDEWQLMDEDAWNLVGAPMLLDNNGDALFIYTPPSLHSRSASKATDPQHASKLFKKYQMLHETDPRYAAFHFRSMDNPYISKAALSEISKDMTSLAYRLEILAEDVDEALGALWTRKIIEANRVISFADLDRIVVSIDPSATSEGDEAGIIVAGQDRVTAESYVLADKSLQGSPLTWARAGVAAYHLFKANCIVAEANNGGEMVSTVIALVDDKVPVELVHASRGKQTRAEPVSSLYEKDKVHHVGAFPELEDEMCLWLPGDPSPNRMDALVWAITKLMGPGWLSERWDLS